MLVISECLGGVLCRYDGGAKTIESLKSRLDKSEAVAVCPEVLGGMSTPREPSEIVGGNGFDVWNGKAKVLSKSGKDVTEQFKQGAIAAYEKISGLGIDCVVFKANSPSCGSSQVYDGTFSGSKIPGPGVTGAYFINHGLKVISEEEWLAEQGD